MAAAVAAAVAATVLAGSGTAGARARTASGTPRCVSSGLVVWLDTRGSGAAGSSYYMLKLTNLSGHSCTLTGYSGVSAVNLRGHQLGKAASRTSSPQPKLVKLADGATATEVLRIVDVSLFTPSACRPVTAAGLRVYPPNQTASKAIPFPFRACSRGGPVYLSVQAIR
ncbi:MAG TPA: DUF4232 domain-containing protein [Solirubrobacteraceae bacterium]|nr:DUF4232 domain-containing protein [Solirubrobacteraceae bacterium]